MLRLLHRADDARLSSNRVSAQRIELTSIECKTVAARITLASTVISLGNVWLHERRFLVVNVHAEHALVSGKHERVIRHEERTVLVERTVSR